jgi:hypothetical protein
MEGTLNKFLILENESGGNFSGIICKYNEIWYITEETVVKWLEKF